MIRLKDTFDESLRQSEDEILEKSSQELLDMFLATMRLEGRSEKTLCLYRFNIEKMLEKSDKNGAVALRNGAAVSFNRISLNKTKTRASKSPGFIVK